LKVEKDRVLREKTKLMHKFSVTSTYVKKRLIKPEQNKHINLPSIQGIVSSLDTNGKVHWIILIDGKGYSKGQTVNGFLVEKITEKGIYLSKYGKKYFVPLPEVNFSIVKE